MDYFYTKKILFGLIITIASLHVVRCTFNTKTTITIRIVEDAAISMKPIKLVKRNASNEIDGKLPVEKCECGLFNYDKKIVQRGEEPLFKLDVEANGSSCRQACSDHYDAIYDYGPIVICATFGEINNLMVSLFSRECNEKHDYWEYAAINNVDEPFCCHGGYKINCAKKRIPEQQNKIINVNIGNPVKEIILESK